MDSGTEDNAYGRAAHRRAPEGNPVPASGDNALLRSLVETSPVAIFHADPEGHCTFVNEHWCELTGRPVHTALGEGWKEAVHPDDVPLIVAEWERSLRLGIEFRMQFRYLRPDGSIVWALGQTVEERDANGELVGYVSTATDITDLQQKLEALQRSQESSDKPGQKKGSSTSAQKRLAGGPNKPGRKDASPPGDETPRPAMSLTPRELEILKLLAQGKTNKEVGWLLGISVKTAETHRARIRRKLAIDSAAALVRYAIRHGFIVP